MALNFSHRRIAHLSEENLVSPMMIANGYMVDGVPERSGDGFVGPSHSNREVEDRFEYGRDRADRSCSPESVSEDILDILPSDPFGMDISTTFTALTGWLEDLEAEYGGCLLEDLDMNYGGYGGNSRGERELFAGLNFIWNKAVQFQAFPSNIQFGDKSNTDCLVGACPREMGQGNTLSQSVFGSVPTVQDAVNLGNEASRTIAEQIQESQEVAESCSDGDVGAPHAALSFALSFLGVRDLLSVEQVCRSFQATVRNDPLLWRCVHIDQPLNERITDDVLLQLTSRAQGNLQCLSLVECPRITDDCLKYVLENNHRLTKLCVPGCTRLSIEGIINNLRAFNSKGTLGIKHLRIGGLYGITDEHYEELKLLLGADSGIQQHGYKPHYYHRGNLYLLRDDDRAIDIETCPRCQKLRLVYDCPFEGCQDKGDTAQACRACRLCIPRCVQCGRCIYDSEYEETFCLEWLCSDCSKQLHKCPERQDGKDGLSKNVVLQEPINNFCHHG